jgi:methyl-accepting chemotaxis protein
LCGFAPSDQADSLSQIKGVVADLDRSTQQNATMAKKHNAAAASLARESGVLGDTVGYFSTASSVARGLQSSGPANSLAAWGNKTGLNRAGPSNICSLAPMIANA